MTTPAVTIQDAIDFCADNIAELSYDGVVAIKPRMDAWVAAMFGAAGIFTDVSDAGQRTVIDWHGINTKASAAIEGSNPGDAGVVSTSGVIDAVSRTLCAVRDAVVLTAVTKVTAAQRTATIAAFNAQWT